MRVIIILLILLLLFPIHGFGTVAACAQGGVTTITDDAVNAVARNLYCPVCPNERLDTCPTEACRQWKEDIRGQLADGRTEEQIIADFVARYGQRAVDTPDDPALRTLSIATPFLIGGAALVVGVWTFGRWQRGRAELVADTRTTNNSSDDAYRTLLERDVNVGG